tara:strand:- start:559 stop:942 length:384 start_codon:yes stop_codon:yes gene_type:complete
MTDAQITANHAAAGGFRSLTAEQEKQFRDAAWKDYNPGTEIHPLFHPVYQSECRAINTAAGIYKIYLAINNARALLEELSTDLMQDEENPDLDLDTIATLEDISAAAEQLADQLLELPNVDNARRLK